MSWTIMETWHWIWLCPRSWRASPQHWSTIRQMLTWWTRAAGVFFTRPSREVTSAFIWAVGIIECGAFLQQIWSRHKAAFAYKRLLLKHWEPSRILRDVYFIFNWWCKYSSHLACFSFPVFLGDEFASTFLIRHSAQVNAATVGAVETPLHLVCSFSPKKHSGEVMAGMAHIAEALLKAGANPNMQNSKGRWVTLSLLH